MHNLTKLLDPVCAFFQRFTLSKKFVAISVLAIFILSFIPIFLMSFYSVASADDYNFAIITHQTWENTHSVLAVLGASIESMIYFFMNWQGFFSANLLPSLNPFVFNENLYFITTFVSVLSFTLSFFYLCKQMLKLYFQADGYDVILVACPILLLFFQLIPSAAEWLFWFDAGQAMVFYGLTFVLIGLMVKYSYINTATIRGIILSCIIAIITSGTSTTATFLLVFMVFKIANDLFMNKKSKSVLFLDFIVFILTIIGFVICLIAPGNSVRESDAVGMPFIKAIIMSFFYSFTFMQSNITAVLTLMLALSPIAIMLVKKSKFSFRYPLLILAVSYCIYASRFFSTLYSMASIGSPRQRNGYFICEIILFTVNLFYFWGWVYKKASLHTDVESIFKKFGKVFKRYSVVFSVLVLVMAGLCAIQFGVKKTTSVSCTLSIISGEAQQYKGEMDKRLEIYLDDSIQDVEFEPLTKIPYVFMEDSVTNDPTNWKNTAIAKYYGKNSVVLNEQSSDK